LKKARVVQLMIEETGDLNPHVRSMVAYNTDSKVIPTVRANGILLAQPTPAGGTISGNHQLCNWMPGTGKMRLIKKM
jgi:hypothetical protein